MSARTIFVTLILMALTGLAFWNMERFQGCTGDSQTVDLELGKKRYVHCGGAQLKYVNQTSGSEIEVSCGGMTPQRTMIYKGSGNDACDMRFLVTDTWKGGPTDKWNARFFITWKEK